MADKETPQSKRGLYGKYLVRRVDGRDEAGGDRENADYFILDLTYDDHARAALAAYAKSCEEQYPALSADLKNKLLGDGPGG